MDVDKDNGEDKKVKDSDLRDSDYEWSDELIGPYRRWSWEKLNYLEETRQMC